VTKADLLRNIADTAYNVGFGAKKHFATYDITAKVPGIIGFVSIAVGVFALFIDELTAKTLSAILIVLGVMAISIGIYDRKKDRYADVGGKLTEFFDSLKSLYYAVKATDDLDLSRFEQELQSVRTEARKISIADQILFSGWYAHYKFFWEHQIDWVDEQKHFRLFRDKIPLSAIAATVLFLMATIVGFIIARC
jgi:SMODS and SLOG-associating 2TM effector domain 6